MVKCEQVCTQTIFDCCVFFLFGTRSARRQLKQVAKSNRLALKKGQDWGYVEEAGNEDGFHASFLLAIKSLTKTTVFSEEATRAEEKEMQKIVCTSSEIQVPNNLASADCA